MQRIKSHENGSAIVLTLFLVVISCVMTVGIMAYTSSQNRSSAYNINRIKAQYIAEAGAKVAIAEVLNTLKKVENEITTSNIGQFNKSAQKINLADGSYTISYGPNSNNPENVSEIIITSVGSVNKTNYKAKVIVALANSILAQESPGVVSLFKNCTYSHNPGTSTKKEDEQVWKITPATDTEPASATPPKAEGNFQVKFNDKFTENTMKISYNAACKNFPGYNNPGGCGYGIYYAMTGTADNPDAYVLQYDPGAGEYGSFFVKRVKARKSAPANAYDNEFNCSTGRYYNEKYWHTEQRWNDSTKKFENVTFYGTTSCDVPLQPTDIYTNDPNDGKSVTWVSLDDPGTDCPNSLKKIMEAAGHKPFDINAPHNITIEVNEKGVHIIKCDGVMILHFKDNTGYAKSVEGTSTGLRTWNADIGFYNDPNKSKNQKLASTIIWQK